jgi:hypothetical protein
MRCKVQNGGGTPINIKILDDLEYLLEKAKAEILFQKAKENRIDIEADDGCLRGFGSIEQRKFYRKVWNNTYNALKASGKLSCAYPEEWEESGYSKEEYDKL